MLYQIDRHAPPVRFKGVTVSLRVTKVKRGRGQRKSRRLKNGCKCIRCQPIHEQLKKILYGGNLSLTAPRWI